MSGLSVKRAYLKDVNPLLTCPICRGYLIDAITIGECSHSFCRSCILKHLRHNSKCPTCEQALNTAKPNIKADKTLQDIVYKLVPGLYQKEMRRRREFYKKHPEHAEAATAEQKGEDVSGRLIFAPEEAISLSLEYVPIGIDPVTLLAKSTDNGDSSKAAGDKDKSSIWRRYLRCPALVTIAHLKKFIAFKYNVNIAKFSIDVCHRHAPLPENWTLMDVAYIFAWKRNSPLRFFYQITPEVSCFENAIREVPYHPPSNYESEEEGDSSEKSEPKSDVSGADSRKKLPEEKLAESSKPEVKVKLEQPEVGGDLDKLPETPMLAKRSLGKEKAKSPDNGTKSHSPPTPKHEDAAKQIKSPLKIAKTSDGCYQVLHGPSLPAKDASLDKMICKSPPAEFSVVSIKDGADSNGFKITLKQCSPGTTGNNSSSSSSSSSSKKPKVISNVLLSKPEKAISDHLHKHEKQKRKVHFVDSELPKFKKPVLQSDKKQFLHSFRLTSKQAAAASAQNNTQQHQEVTNSEQSVEQKKSPAEETNGVLKSSDSSHNSSSSRPKEEEKEKEKDSTKKRRFEIKITSTNIADRLGEAKPSTDGSTQAISSSNEEPQQPIDVYAFPNDPPASLPPGAVKRKCPGAPLLDARKKQQQEQQQQQQQPQQPQQPQQVGKKTGVNVANSTTPVKCYRNLAKPSLYAKPSQSPTTAQQNTSSPSNTTVPNSIASSAVSSTSPKKSLPLPSPSVMISNDTRSLLDGCGLNIPASLSITLTSPRSSAGSGSTDTPDSRKDSLKQNVSDSKLNPSISLNDRDVDPRVLKALKSGQMRMPDVQSKVRPMSPEQQNLMPAIKRRKTEQAILPSPPKNLLDLSSSKNADLQGLKVPIAHSKNIKIRPVPPSWSQANNPKVGPKDANSQVVTLTDGQRYYRAPPGSLTPAAHRMGDIPMPSRAPVYAPSAYSSSPMIRPPSSFSVFPSLQSLYALNQAPSLEQFRMDARLRISPVKKDTGIQNNAQVNRSHLAAQCAPVRPTRTFAMPIAKNSKVAESVGGPPLSLMKQPIVNTASAKSETTSSGADSAADREVKSSDNSKEALPRAEIKENCLTSIDEKNSSQEVDSPRVTSTASPSPPPSVSDSTTDNIRTPSSESDKCQSTVNTEVANINKSPESPDSSSVVTESTGNLVDSTKSAMEKNKTFPMKDNESKDEASIDEKKNDKVETTKMDKPLEALQKRFVATFPVSEWGKEGFRNFIDSLPGLRAEAQSKNAKVAE